MHGPPAMIGPLRLAKCRNSLLRLPKPRLFKRILQRRGHLDRWHQAMAKIGVIAPSASGRLNPSLPLGRAPKDRGRHAIAFAAIDEREKVDKSGLERCAIGKERCPEGECRKKIQALGEAAGKDLLRKALALMKEWAEALIEDLPRQIEELGIDLMIVDECSPAAPSCCERADIPFAMISNAAVVKHNPTSPLFHSCDGPIATLRGRIWNRIQLAALSLLIS